MASKSYTSSIKNNRDSISKHLGLKKFNNQFCKNGQILIKQRGLTIKPGRNICKSKDFTLYASQNGILKFKTIKIKKKYYKKIDIIENNWETIANAFNYKHFSFIRKSFIKKIN